MRPARHPLLPAVPSGATTGTITVTVGGQTAISSTSFTFVPPPTIISFSPTSAGVGAIVTITGTGFDTTPANSIVKFNGILATITGTPTATSITTPVPSGATTGTITVTVGGQTGTSTTNFTVITDTTPPTVTDNTPASVNFGSDITISATITDGESTITAASVSYRSVSAGGSVTTKTLTAVASVYSLKITTAEIGELGIEYKISATSAGGTSLDATYKVIKVNVTGTGLTIPYSSFGIDVANYRIVATPLALGSNTVNDVFADDLGAYDKTKWRMYRYDNGTTAELSVSTPIDPGKGYWLIVKTSGPTISTGPGGTVQTKSDAPFEIDLKADWNEIGNPYNFAISWADVQAANPGLPGLRLYNGDFIDGTKLNKMEGGFVKVTSAQKLKFPVLKNPAIQGGRTSGNGSLLTNSIDQPNWQVYFNLQQGNLHNRISGLGMNVKASENFDLLDGFNMPQFFETFIELDHRKKEGKDFYSSDIVPNADHHIWDFDIVSTKEEGPITLSWDNSYFGANDKELYLWDVSLQRSINMRLANSYAFQKNTSGSFKVIYGPAAFVKEKIAVQGLIIHGLWPNPTSEGVTVSFTLPESPSAKTLEFSITDLTGRKIWGQESAFGSGYHEVSWNRTVELAPGLYIMKLGYGAESEVRRLVLK